MSQSSTWWKLISVSAGTSPRPARPRPPRQAKQEKHLLTLDEHRHERYWSRYLQTETKWCCFVNDDKEIGQRCQIDFCLRHNPFYFFNHYRTMIRYNKHWQRTFQWSQFVIIITSNWLESWRIAHTQVIWTPDSIFSHGEPSCRSQIKRLYRWSWGSWKVLTWTWSLG